MWDSEVFHSLPFSLFREAAIRTRGWDWWAGRESNVRWDARLKDCQGEKQAKHSLGNNVPQELKTDKGKKKKKKKGTGQLSLKCNIAQKNPTEVQVMIDNVLIERVHEIKFLGVILDNKFCWKPQIKHVRTKVAKCIAILGKSQHILDHKSLYILYWSLVLPYLIYCVEVWGNIYKSTLQSLCTLQKRTIRIVNKVGYHKLTFFKNRNFETQI